MLKSSTGFRWSLCAVENFFQKSSFKNNLSCFTNISTLFFGFAKFLQLKGDKMREIVHIQAGQCGNQIGAKVRKEMKGGAPYYVILCVPL